MSLSFKPVIQSGVVVVVIVIALLSVLLVIGVGDRQLVVDTMVKALLVVAVLVVAILVLVGVMSMRK